MGIVDAILLFVKTSTWVIVIVPVVIFFILKFTSSKRKLLLKIPGPKGNLFFGNALHFAGPREDVFKKLMDIFANFSNETLIILWFGSTPKVGLQKAKSVEALLSSNTLLAKSNDYKFLHPWLSTGLLTSTGTKWRTRRKLITPSFHFRILDEFLHVFNEKSDILVSLLEKHAGKGAFDIDPYLSRCTLDIICETAMGQGVNALGNSDSDYVKAVNKMTELIFKRTISPWLHPDFMFELICGREQRKYLNILHGFTNKVIKERRQEVENKKLSKDVQVNGESEDVFGRKRRLAFLDMLLESSIEGRRLSDEDIREEVDTFMFEGHDTTSSGLNFALYCIGRHPDIQQKIYEELDSILGGSDRPFSSEDLKEMKLLECVIKESLRFFPPVPFYARQLQGNLRVDEYTIPAGTIVFTNAVHIHRDPEVFQDPMKFDPSRFLAENSVNRHPYAYLPFSAGPRNCIGQKFALMEEKVVIAYILRKYKVTATVKEEDLKVISEIVLRPANGTWLTLEPRN